MLGGIARDDASGAYLNSLRVTRLIARPTARLYIRRPTFFGFPLMMAERSPRSLARRYRKLLILLMRIMGASALLVLTIAYRIQVRSDRQSPCITYGLNMCKD